MKNLTKIVSSVLAVGVLLTTGITAFATTDTEANTTTSSNTTISEKSCDKGSMKKVELTDEQKAEKADKMKETLAQKLDDGSITQEQYDKAIANIADGKKPMILGEGNKDRPELTDEQKAEKADKMKETLAQKLEDGSITQEQYDKAIANIADGKKPEILGKGDKERPELTDEQKAEMIDKMKETLAQKLEDGSITQEQYDKAIANIADGKRPMILGKGNMKRQNESEVNGSTGE
ncbi:MAG: hypothetical protein EOM05_03940 [Clostridia bacterium]|nr:hypothetical protein [Clostridia bacterium]